MSKQNAFSPRKKEVECMERNVKKKGKCIMRDQQEKRREKGSEKRFVKLWKMALHAMVMALFVALLLPLSGYSAKAETDDFLLYVESVTTVSGYGTVVSGRVSGGRLNAGDQVFHTYTKSDGSVGYRFVTASKLYMFRKSLDYVENGDNCEIVLGDYSASQIHVGDALISDISGFYQPYQGPIFGTYSYELNDAPALPANNAIVLKKGNVTINAKLFNTDSLLHFFNPIQRDVFISSQDITHVYSLGEQFDVYNNGTRIGTFTVKGVANSPLEAMTDLDSPRKGGFTPQFVNFSTGSSYSWRVSEEDGVVFAKCGNSDVANSTSTMTYTTNYRIPISISFSYKFNTESGDKAYFLIDDEPYVTNGFSRDYWTNQTFHLSAGSHTLTWKYVKDSSEIQNNDFYGVCDFEIYPAREVRLDANGGYFGAGTAYSPKTETDSMYIYRGQSLGLSEDSEDDILVSIPSKKGYRFCGYSTNPVSEKGTRIESLCWGDLETVKTYYAIWDRIEYNVFQDLYFSNDEPYWDDVENIWIPADPWNKVDSDGDHYGWSKEYYDTMLDYPVKRSSSVIEKGSGDRVSCTPDNWLVSPAIKLGNMKYSLRFRVKNDETFSVYVGTANDISKMMKLKDFQAGGERECVVPLDGYENKTV
ncbi:MAG: hypothetical protein J5825_07450, partial [Lachnospiraceae bacterium]|nr:hypothetical protein [Lachnospiraceae bacterium]